VHDVESAIELIRARDDAAATLARALWQTIRMGAAHPTRITRYDVQRMIWESVPHAIRRPDGPDTFPDRHAIREALAELLELLGYPDYAELCRSVVTRDILDAAEDLELCERLAAEAWAASGIDPPTTPIFNWHDPCGPVEEALHGAAGRILEEALDAGVITLGQADTEDQRVALTMRLMISPDNDGADTWFVRLLDERLDAWTLGHGSQTRREMLVRVRPEVRHTPELTDADLPALQLLLAACVDGGTRLTQRGYLPTGLVSELIDLMPTCQELDDARHIEANWPPVQVLRELATDFGMIHRVGNRLKLTDLGLRLGEDADSLLMCTGEAVITFEHAALGILQEVIFAALLLEDLIEPERLFEKVVRVFQEDGWTDESGEPFGLRHADTVGSWFLRRLRVLDIAEVSWSTRRIGLTDAGRSIARWALRARVLYRKVKA
jgi:hypothetical protein